MTSNFNAQHLTEVCNSVWHDRSEILFDIGELDGDVALVRAVYWRLCKTANTPPGTSETKVKVQTLVAYQSEVAALVAYNAKPLFDSEPILNELLELYETENQELS